MSSRRRVRLLVLMVAVSTLLATAQNVPQVSSTSPAGAEVRVLPPLALSQPGATGAGPQFIGYQQGRLQILADDSTLSSILSSIGPLIGARIDFPAELANERVAVHMTSVSPSDAIGGLLNGSRYDYIIMGSPAHPEAVNHVIVRLRNGAAPAPSVAVGQAGTAAQPSLAKDFYGEARLPNGLTPQEQVLSREELYQKFASAQQTQRQQQQQVQEQIGGPDPKVGRR